MSALERAVATANELMKKLSECSDLASTIASTMAEESPRAVRKFDDITLGLWALAKEVEEYDWSKK
jgi:hypothetical protein